MSDKLDMIYDLLKQDRKEASGFRKEVRDSSKATSERLTALEASSQIQNQQLATHIKRSNILEEMHGDNAKRIDGHDDQIAELEKPKIVMSVLKKWIVGTGTIAAAIVGIAKLIGLF